MARKMIWPAAIAALALLAVPALIVVAEHPEHPSAAKRGTVTKEELAVVITDYVDKDAQLKGGYFLVYDTVAGKALALSLLKVHKERLSKVGKETYFACADFETPEGKVYDLDVFMKGPNKDKLAVTQITVHKEDGEARYTWYKDGKIWKMRPKPGAEGSGGKSEHPDKEHPDKEHPHKEHPDKN